MLMMHIVFDGLLMFCADCSDFIMWINIVQPVVEQLKKVISPIREVTVSKQKPGILVQIFTYGCDCQLHLP